MKYVCKECNIEMQETTLFENKEEVISLCCTKCKKWATVPRNNN